MLRLRLLTVATLTTAVALLGAGAGGASSGGAGAQPQITIGMSHYAGVIPFYRSMTAGLQAGAKKYGWKLIITDANFDPSKQISNIETLIARKVDAIIASPGDENALITAYKAANTAKIPILSIANHIAPSAKRYESSFYGRPWDAVAERRTVRLAKLLGGKGEIAAIRGPSAIAFVRDDLRGFNRAIKRYPGIKVVFGQNAKTTLADEGLRLAQDALTAHPNVNGIWVEADDLAEGVARVLRERGLAGKVKMVSMDGAPSAMRNIKAGILSYTAALPTYSWGLNQMRILRDHLVNGKPLPKYVPARVIDATKANVDRLLAQCKQTPREVWCGK